MNRSKHDPFFSNMFYVHPRKLGKMNPVLRAYFSNGLVQPPTSESIGKFNVFIGKKEGRDIPYCSHSVFADVFVVHVGSAQTSVSMVEIARRLPLCQQRSTTIWTRFSPSHLIFFGCDLFFVQQKHMKLMSFCSPILVMFTLSS